MAVIGTYHQRESLAELVRTRARARGVRAGQLSLLVCALCALTYLVQHPRAGSSKVLEVVLGSANHGYREKVEGLEWRCPHRRKRRSAVARLLSADIRTAV